MPAAAPFEGGDEEEARFPSEPCHGPGSTHHFPGETCDAEDTCASRGPRTHPAPTPAGRVDLFRSYMLQTATPKGTTQPFRAAWLAARTLCSGMVRAILREEERRSRQ